MLQTFVALDVCARMAERNRSDLWRCPRKFGDERRRDRPEYAAPAFQSNFAQEVILMHLILKVVYKTWTIVFEWRWPKSRR